MNIHNIQYHHYDIIEMIQDPYSSVFHELPMHVLIYTTASQIVHQILHENSWAHENIYLELAGYSSRCLQ